VPEGGVKKSSNLPFYLLGAGFASLGAYMYLDKTMAQTKSPLDPQNFVDFKLKRVEPYNHNTSKSVSHHLPYLQFLNMIRLKVHI
jgi:cytochrome-b5 reductase